MGIQSPWAAYQFDMACLLAGLKAENEVMEKARPSSSGSNRLTTNDLPKDESGYSDLGTYVQAIGGAKKMEVPESGIW